MLSRFQPEGQTDTPIFPGHQVLLCGSSGAWRMAESFGCPGCSEPSCSLRPFISACLCLGAAPVNALVSPCPLVTQAFPLLSAPLVVAMGRGCSRSYAG